MHLYIKEGWKKGSLTKGRKISKEALQKRIGKKWINNSIISRLAKEVELTTLLQEGWVLGRIYPS
jgi:hypothetical protein